MQLNSKQNPFVLSPNKSKDALNQNGSEYRVNAEYNKLIEAQIKKKGSKRTEKSKQKKGAKKRRGNRRKSKSSKSTKSSNSTATSTTTKSDDDDDDDDDSDDSEDSDDSDSSTSSTDSDHDDDDEDDDDDDNEDEDDEVAVEEVGDLDLSLKPKHKLTASKILKMSSAPIGSNVIGLVDDEEDMKHPPIPSFGAATTSGMREHVVVKNVPAKSPVVQVLFTAEYRKYEIL